MHPRERSPGAAPAGASGKRPYLYELDPIRAVTALCVIGVHVTSGTLIFYYTALGVELQGAAVTALHFTREIFLTLTAFVLAYGYAHRPFAFATFWRKRGAGVLLPYVVWSLFYVWFAVPHLPIARWLGSAAYATLTGSASYQLYYILLTLELYLILPAFLWLLARVERRPWTVLAVSFAAQLALLYLDYRYIQAGPLSRTAFGRWANAWQDRLLFMYEFPIMLGGVAALHRDRVRAFALRHGRWAVAALVVGLSVHWLHYGAWMAADPRGLTYAISALQPTMLAYGLAVTLFLYWLACRWAARAAPGEAPRGFRFWQAISNASFGIYLVHAFILSSLVLPSLAPLLPTAWPAPLRVGLIWLLVAATSTGISLGFLYVPGLSRLMGRACLLPPGAAPSRALAAVRRSIPMLPSRGRGTLAGRLRESRSA